jgi:transcriptional regulator with XRE-family HTH domain
MTAQSTMPRSKKGLAVGRKRTPLKGRGKTPREIFARRLNQLWGERSAVELAEKCGVSQEAAAKWLQGHNVPDLDTWPVLARALGVRSVDLVSFE